MNFKLKKFNPIAYFSVFDPFYILLLKFCVLFLLMSKKYICLFHLEN